MRLALLTVFFLSLASPPITQAAAADKDPKESTYEIDALVFEIRLPELIGEELLTRNTPPEPIRGLENAESPDAGTDSTFFYPEIARQLEQDGHYRILSHVHWTQTVDAKTIAKPVRIVSTTPGALDGTIRFFMSRYLHLDVNLAFREPVTVAGADTPPPIYRLSEQRRIKTQEIQYFDHPRFGVLVRVMPVEKEKK